VVWRFGRLVRCSVLVFGLVVEGCKLGDWGEKELKFCELC